MTDPFRYARGVGYGTRGDQLSGPLIGLPAADVAAHTMLPQRPCTIAAFAPANAGARRHTSSREPGFHIGTSRESRDPANQIRGFFSNHDRRRVGICAHQRRHDRRVDDTQAFRPPYAQLSVDDGEIVVPHPTRSHRMVNSVGPLAQQRTYVFVRTRSGCVQILRHERRHRRRRHQPSRELVSLDEDIQIVRVLEEGRVDQRRIQRIRASQFYRSPAFRPQHAYVTRNTMSELHLPAMIADRSHDKVHLDVRPVQIGTRLQEGAAFGKIGCQRTLRDFRYCLMSASVLIPPRIDTPSASRLFVL